MTVQNDKTKKNHTGTGAVLDFSYDFLLLDEAHIQVYLDDVLQESGYTVSGVGLDEGGDVTFAVAPALDVIITLLRFVPYTQLIDYIDYDRFAANTHERALDLIVMACTQLQEQLDRAMVAALSADPDLSFILPARDAGKALMWSETLKAIVNSTDDFNTIVAQCQAALASCTGEVAAAAAQAGFASDSRIAADAAASAAQAAQLAAETAQTAAEAAQAVVEAFPNTANTWGAPQSYALDERNPAGAATTIDPLTDPAVLLRLDQNITITLETFGGHDVTVVIDVVNVSGGPYTITWAGDGASGLVWPDEIDPTAGPDNARCKIFHIRRSVGRQRGAIVWEGSQY